jgi:hypothetical protein
MKVAITGWERGFLVVDFIKILTKNGYGLIESKNYAERILDGKRVELTLEDPVSLRELSNLNLHYSVCSV